MGTTAELGDDAGTGSPSEERVTDARVLRSRAAVKSAFAELSQEHRPGSISISQLCKAAGLSRPTFYQHFADVDDVYASMIRDDLDAQEERLTREASESGSASSDVLEHILAQLQHPHAGTAAAIDSRGALPRARSVVFAWLCDRVAQGVFGAETEALPPLRRHRVEFAVGGLMAVLGRAIRDHGEADPEDSPEEAAAMLREAMRVVLVPES